MKKIDNTTYVEKVGQTLWIRQDSETWSYDLVELTSEGQRRKKTNSSTPDMIVAPMPGKITKIFVSPGQEVMIGQPLIAMEAMKMEYTLKSDLATKVEQVLVAINDQVQVATVLVKLVKIK